jgi:uncharacterized protein (TIGR02996 family)
MTDREALLAAIHAEPDDDTPRLVYADWLQENGQPERADFIRLQIEAVRAEPFGPQGRRAAERARDLLEAHRHAWTRHLHDGFVEWPRFERGFVTQLSIEPSEFVPRAAALLQAEPIQALKLFRFASTGDRVSFQPLWELPSLRQLRRLELSSRLLAEEEFGDLAACPYLSSIRDLGLRDNPVPPQWLGNLLRSDRMPELTGLDLRDNSHLGPCLSTAFPDAGTRSFRRLDLTGIVFSSEQIQRVLTCRCLSRVEELRLACVPRFGDAGPLFHLDLGFVLPWGRISVLDLSGQQLGNEGVREIVLQPEGSTLRWLGLANNMLGPDAVRYLVDSRHLQLNYLNVRGNNFTLSDLAALQRRFPEAVIES